MMPDVATCQRCGHRLVRGEADLDWRHVNAYGFCPAPVPVPGTVRSLGPG
jgi:hypothetical protein